MGDDRRGFGLGAKCDLRFSDEVGNAWEVGLDGTDGERSLKRRLPVSLLCRLLGFTQLSAQLEALLGVRCQSLCGLARRIQEKESGAVLLGAQP